MTTSVTEGASRSLARSLARSGMCGELLHVGELDEDDDGGGDAAAHSRAAAEYMCTEVQLHRHSATSCRNL